MRESVYGFQLPAELSAWLSFSEVLSFDLGSFIFPSWTCVGGLTTRIVFSGMWPLVAMLTVALALVGREVLQGRPVQRALSHSLQVAIFISFCVLPSVTRSLFLAFQCENFKVHDDTMMSKSYLTASLDVECNTGQHTSIIAIALLFIVIWPVAMPLLYALLLFRCRSDIQSHNHTALSKAIKFLWGEYEGVAIHGLVLSLLRPIPHLSPSSRSLLLF